MGAEEGKRTAGCRQSERMTRGLPVTGLSRYRYPTQRFPAGEDEEAGAWVTVSDHKWWTPGG